MERPRTSISTEPLKPSPSRCASTARDRTGIPALRTGRRLSPLPGAMAQDDLGDVERLTHLGDLVHPEHLRSAKQRQRVGGDRAAEPVTDLAARELAEEALAGGTDHDRPAELAQLADSPQELEVVLDGLAEADPGIDPDAPLPAALRVGELDPLSQEALDVVDDVTVPRSLLHRAWRALHVHEHEAATALGAQRRELGL